MQPSTLKWVAGIIFFLPSIVVIVARLSGETDIQGPFWGSFVLAGIIPPILVIRSKVKRRVLYAVGLLVLLVAQFCLTLLILLAGFRS